VKIASTQDAALCLLEDWPEKKGKAYHRAILGCTKALKGDISPIAARLCVLEAAEGANLPFELSDASADVDPFTAEIAEICNRIAFLEDLGA
jgi:hypothetical protein